MLGVIFSHHVYVCVLFSSNIEMYGLVPTRFLILLCVCLSGFVQNLVWFTFAGFPAATSEFFGVSLWWVSFTLQLGPIGYVCSFWIVSLVDKIGLRMTVVLSSLCSFFCCALRVSTVFYRHHSIAWPVICIAQFFNALAGPSAMAVPAKMSQLWFCDGRPVATSLAVLANSLGGAIGFVLALLVETPQSDIPTQLYVHTGLSGVSFFCALIFMRDAPHVISSPSSNRDVKSIPVLASLGKMMRNPSLWLLVFGAGMTQGVFSNWASLLGFLIQSQNLSKWIGFSVILASCVSGAICGFVAVVLKRRFKVCILIDDV